MTLGRRGAVVVLGRWQCYTCGRERRAGGGGGSDSGTCNFARVGT